MTLAQRAILGVGMMVFGVMGLLPPWVHVYADDPPDRVPAGYAFVTVGTPVRPDGPNDPDALPRRGRFRPSYRGTPVLVVRDRPPAAGGAVGCGVGGDRRADLAGGRQAVVFEAPLSPTFDLLTSQGVSTIRPTACPSRRSLSTACASLRGLGRTGIGDTLPV